MNHYTEDEEVITEARLILFTSQRLPRVLDNLIMDYVRWDWPCPGETVAVMDSGAYWCQGRVCHRTYDEAFVHYYGWNGQNWDEWINRRWGTSLDHLALTFPNTPDPLSDDIGVVFPRLRSVTTMANFGTWQADLRITSSCEGDPIGEVKTLWRAL